MPKDKWPYREKARKALRDPVFQRGLEGIQLRIGKATLERYKEVPDIETLRVEGLRIRMKAIENLEAYLKEFAYHVEEGGGMVFFAKDADEAVDFALKVCSAHKVKTVVKGKSMVGEEIRLNRALEERGIRPIETDLGEYIIQLAGEGPSHIIGPAIHKSKEQIGRLFSDKLGVPYTSVPEELTSIARRALRERFFEADMGITGANLAIADSGHVMLVSNEGNIRFSITLPRVHLVVMGMERIVKTLEEALLILRLLSRAAAAQRLATYVSIVGPKEKIERGGAFYVIVVDNGRSKIASDSDFKEALACVRCGACLNICPVYGKIGGYAYGEVYSGPIGAIINPLLFGIDTYSDLFFGETLCGACKERCPLHIDIPRMLLELRRRYKEGDPHFQVAAKKGIEYVLLKGFEIYNRAPFLSKIGTRLSRLIVEK